MQVFLHQLDGSVNTIDLSEYNSLESLLSAFGADSCRVVYQGAHLLTLEDLENNANLYLTGDLDGGKKKKKKSTEEALLATPKKDIHRETAMKAKICSTASCSRVLELH